MRSQLRMHTAIALAIILCAAIASTAATSAAVPAAGLSVTVAAVDWAHLNATTLNAINATEFLSVSAAQLASIPADACAGFTSSQLASTGATTATGGVCAGLTPNCIGQMLPTAVAGLTTSCAASLLPASVGALTAAQLMSGLPDAVCGVWDFNQTAAFASPKCQHLGMFCLQNWMADSMGGFTADCVGGMTAAQLATFSAPQISGLSVAVAAIITSSNNNMMSVGCAGWTAAQFSLMPTDAFYGWTASCSSHFTPAGLGGWLRAQMRSYSRRLFWTWTVEQVAGLSPLGASGISPAAAKGLPPALCKGFHAPQIAFFRDFYTQCVCEQWSPACLANISPAEYVGFTQLCMQRLRTDALAVLTAEQVKNINPVTFGAISPKQLAMWGADACSGIQPSQLVLYDQAFPSTGCAGFNTSCFSALSTDALGSISQQCVSHVAPTVFASLSADQFAALPDSAFSSMPRATVAQLKAQHCEKISADQLALIGSVFPNDAALGLSAACLAALPSTSCVGITPTFMAAFAAAPADVQAQLIGLNSACVANLPAAACASAGASFFSNIPTDSCAGIAPTCMANVTASGVSGMGVPCIRALQPAVFAALPRAAAAGLNATQCEVLTGEELSLIGSGTAAPDAAQGLTSDCLGALTGPTCGATNDHLFNGLDGEACVGFTPTCFANVTANGASGLAPECVATLPVATFVALPLASFRALKADVFARVSRADVAALSPDRCAALTGDALNQMGSTSPYDAPLGMSPDCLGALAGDACAHTGARFFNTFDDSAESLQLLGFVGHPCVKAINCDTFDELRPPTRNALNSADMAEVKRGCADSSGAGGKSKERTKWILIGVFCGLTALVLVGWIVRKCMRKRTDSHAVNLDSGAEYLRAPDM